jgi:hypothetical protein
MAISDAQPARSKMLLLAAVHLAATAHADRCDAFGLVPVPFRELPAAMQDRLILSAQRWLIALGQDLDERNR